MEYTDRSGHTVYAYTQEERAEALTTSLTALAQELGYTPMRCGSHYSLKEMDSLVIYNDASWKRWSGKGNRTGGSQIDFLLEFSNVSSVPEAINYLLRFQGKSPEHVVAAERHIDWKIPTSEFVLPEKNKNYRRLYAYLIKTRKLSPDVVNDFVHRGLIYESKEHHNLVFCGMDKQGVVRYAGMRGTSNLAEKAFKCDVPGNDKNYGVNIVNKENPELKVFEGVIDCMSYIDMYNDHFSNKLVLGMVDDHPLIRFLEEYSHIKRISFCLDNDRAGQRAVYGETLSNGEYKLGLKEKYEKLGYEVTIEIPPEGKDFNESLVIMRDKGLKHLQGQENNITGIEKTMKLHDYEDNQSYVDAFYENMMRECGYTKQELNLNGEIATVKFSNADGRTYASDGYGDCAAWLLEDPNLSDLQRGMVNQMDSYRRKMHLFKKNGQIAGFYMDHCSGEKFSLSNVDGYKYTEDNIHRIYYDFDGLLTAREIDGLKAVCLMLCKKMNIDMLQQSGINGSQQVNTEAVKRMKRGR